MDKLLKLIEKGNPEVILSEEELVPRFNELLKYDLIELKDDKVLLTEKGHEAKKYGVETVLKKERRERFVKKEVPKNNAFPAVGVNGRKQTVKILNLGILLLLLSLAILFLFQYSF